MKNCLIQICDDTYNMQIVPDTTYKRSDVYGDFFENEQMTVLLS